MENYELKITAKARTDNSCLPFLNFEKSHAWNEFNAFLALFFLRLKFVPLKSLWKKLRRNKIRFL